MQFIVKYGFLCVSGFGSFPVHLVGQKNPISTVVWLISKSRELTIRIQRYWYMNVFVIGGGR